MARYFIRFPHQYSSLNPIFTYFRNATTFAIVTPPTIFEVNGVGLGNGSYYFDYSPSFAIVWEVDGGVAVVDEHDRWVPGEIGPEDTYLDEPVSQVKNDVWDELINGHQTAGSTGRILNDLFRLLKNKAIINPITKKMDVYDDAGVAVVFSFDLKDSLGVATATKIFQRIPA